jgi:trans-feruloyl-CoA hydratase/vanillin synthase
MQLIGCDFALAAENATFSLSEVNWGILPGALVSKVVADALLPRHALYYAALGEPFDGNEAERIGLINFAYPAEQLRAKTTALATRLMEKSPKVLRATKHALRQVRTMDVTQAYDYLAEKSKAIRVGDKEDSYNTGLRQFLEEKSYKPAFEPFKLGTMLKP